MKKKVWLLGVAVAALSSCTQSEVLDVPESRQIRFETFVEKNSRALDDVNDTKLDNLLNYWVFGSYTREGDFTDNVNVFEGTSVYRTSTTTPWNYVSDSWAIDVTYRFAAYSNGNQVVANTAYDAAKDELLIPGYVTYDQADIDDYDADDIIRPLDLVASIPGDRIVTSDVSTQGEVRFQLRHLLSKVTIHFVNKSNKADVKFEDIKLHNIYKNGECRCYFPGTTFPTGIEGYNGATEAGSFPKNVVWTTSGDAGDFVYGDIEVPMGTGVTTSDDLTFYLVPQSNASATLTFDLTETIDGDNYNDKPGMIFNLATDTYFSTSVADKIVSHWAPGYHYRYVITLGSEYNDIQFAVDVNQWNKDRNGDTTPGDASDDVTPVAP